MVIGFTVTLVPVPTLVPPQLPLYHFQLPPVPNVPPFTLNTDGRPPHMVVTDAVTALTGVDVSLTVTLMLLHTVLLQVPSAFT